ncbi:MAG: ROK family glucokinase [Thermoleophilia bacterium]
MPVMLGVDLGGTKIAVGAVSEDGSVRGGIIERPTEKAGPEELAGALLQILREARELLAPDALGVGVGSAGTIDWSRGRVMQSPNLPLADFPLAERVGRGVGLPVALDNDANVATLAEARVGVAEGLEHVVMLTLGTGVGGGILLNGRLYRGKAGGAGELGHMVVAAGGQPCPCGRRGCLEQYASGTALERFAENLALGSGTTAEYGQALRELIENDDLTGRTVGRLALAGDAAAGDAVARVADWLGVGLANLANIFNPEMIVIGGGLAELGETLVEPARRVMRESALRPNGEMAAVEAAVLGNRAGVVGAGLVAWEELEQRGTLAG